MTLFEVKQLERIVARIRYAKGVVRNGGPHAHTKAKILPQLERAVEKIHQGTYFICDVCGGDIHQERLAAVPGAVHCAICQGKHETLPLLRS